MNIFYPNRLLSRLFVWVLLLGLLGSNIGPFVTPIASAAPSYHKEALSVSCSPAITFTSVPPFASPDNTILSGRVDCVTPANYKVAVYIYVSGWWTKPTFASPLTSIRSDGTWSTNIVTGGYDRLATRIAAFVLPNGVNPPPMGGGQTLPSELFSSSVAHRIIDRYRTIEFSGRTWNVKASEVQAVGPGPNYFSAGENDVWVDGNGNLHLTITYRNGKWYCTEVFTQTPFGYGTYTFVLASPIDQMDKNAVLGLFTWDDNAPEDHYREIDIEFSRWGNALADNSQYVVQPYDRVGNIYRFNTMLIGVYSTHGFKWESDRVFFSSLQGHAPNPGSEIDSWTYVGADIPPEIDSWTYVGADIPPEGEGNARINLWLYNGVPPSNNQKIEVVIEAFHHIPVTNADTTGVFRPGNGLLYLKNNNTTGFADVAINYGMGGDYPVVGDWDGNGTTTIGIYRNGSFYLRNSNTVGFANIKFPYGMPGDQPVAGDWDGDGTDTIGIYRPSKGLFLLRNSNSAGDPDLSFYLGNVGDVGIAGDWNGDGIDTVGVFRPSNGVIFLKNTNETGFADVALNYGLAGDLPVTGDWNNDGIDTIGVYRQGKFYLRNSNTVGFADLIFALGIPGDVPIAGDWDGLRSALEMLVEKAREDLAQRLAIPIDQTRLVHAAEVVWPDASLGCPQPGMAYAQVLIPGYLILLENNHLRYEYHAGTNGNVFYCENPRPPVGISEN